METILKIDNIEKYYGNKSSLTKAIDNISFEVGKGEFVSIMGASGSGKTTLLNCISTLDKVTTGKIYVGGNEITQLKGNKLNKFRREELGFIFQDFNLLDTLTAFENIALALSIQNVPAREIELRVRQTARELGIEDVLNKYPYQMSGGQKQRVASARAIITNPKLILADEPTGSVTLVQHYPNNTRDILVIINSNFFNDRTPKRAFFFTGQILINCFEIIIKEPADGCEVWRRFNAGFRYLFKCSSIYLIVPFVVLNVY